MGFLSSCWSDEEHTEQFAASSLGLIGDFGDTYKTAVRDALMQEWVQIALGSVRQKGTMKLARINALYAQKVRPF